MPHTTLAVRGNENINGLIHQYQPKGTDLSTYKPGAAGCDCIRAEHPPAHAMQPQEPP
ncbi:hypothetical protein OF001_U400021 [Pseudomonas sp. OF001]|nr:hypothetical protein OF001_U400021 [Pseudomonas sp. OF001]